MLAKRVPAFAAVKLCVDVNQDLQGNSYTISAGQMRHVSDICSRKLTKHQRLFGRIRKFTRLGDIRLSPCRLDSNPTTHTHVMQ